MSTDLTVHDGTQQPAPYYATDPTGGRLVAWAEGLAAAHRIGSALCQTAFAPAHFRGKPDEAAAAIMFGDEIGLSPTQSLRSIFVISGTPGLYARQMVALVLHHGHEVWTVEKTPAKVTVAGKRRGSTHVIEETWTTARATKAGYTNNKKYTTDPESMLYARAASDVCRQVAPDALAGLAYTVEELELGQDEPTTVSRRPAPKTTAQRAPMEEPSLEPPESIVDEDTGEVAGITEPQSKALHASFRDAGIEDREQRLTYCRNLIGRDLTTSSDLTKAEASKIIDALKVDGAIFMDEEPAS